MLKLRLPTWRKYPPEELYGFELGHGVRLPAAYRRQLTEVGISSISRLLPLEEWCTPHAENEIPESYLQQDFPHTEPFDDRAAADFFSGLQTRGSMRIQNLGCDAYLLLVVSGPQRGGIWCDGRYSGSKGLYPLRDRWGRRVSIDDFLGPWWTWWKFTGDLP